MKLNINKNCPEQGPLNFKVVTYQFNWARGKLGIESQEEITFSTMDELKIYVSNMDTINSQLYREAKRKKAPYFLAKQLEKI